MAKYALFSIIFLISIFSLFNCNDKGVTGDPFTTISGYVIDSITRMPIDSAYICIDDTIEYLNCGYTDTIGFYQYLKPGYSQISIFCMKEGYISQSRSIRSSFFNTVFRNIDFELVQRSI